MPGLIVRFYPSPIALTETWIGWMGDAQVSSDAAMFHFDMQPFYTKFLQDMKDDQERQPSIIRVRVR